MTYKAMLSKKSYNLQQQELHLLVLDKHKFTPGFLRYMYSISKTQNFSQKCFKSKSQTLKLRLGNCHADVITARPQQLHFIQMFTITTIEGVTRHPQTYTRTYVPWRHYTNASWSRKDCAKKSQPYNKACTLTSTCTCSYITIQVNAKANTQKSSHT